MIKLTFKPKLAALSVIALMSTFPAPMIHASSPVFEMEREFLTTGDFDGDGKMDVAVVDRPTGRVRFGYALGDGVFDWVEWRSSGTKDTTGVTVGRLSDAKADSLAFAAADINLVTALEARSRSVPADSVTLPNTALGPNLIVAIDIGGAGNNAFDDLIVSSIYNSDPTPNHISFFRSGGKAFTQIIETPTPLAISRGNRLALKRGGKEYVVSIGADAQGERLHVETMDSGKAETVLTIPGIPQGSDYLAGYFRGGPLREFVFYAPGESNITVRPVEEAGGKFQAGAAKTITVTRPIRHLAVVEGEKKSRLMAVFGDTEPAELMDFDGVTAPVMVQQLAGATNRFLNAAIALPDSVVLLSATTNDRPYSATHYQVYALNDGSYKPGVYGSLPSLDDRDEWTVPEIHTRIVAALKEKTAADMKEYTNAIPGTEVIYEMVPIPGGEFLMGSPDGEKARKPDEGPQHKVKVSPFWMGKYEVTWDQYLLFMYPDDEKNLRETFKTPEDVNTVSDAVTRPSKPYVSMDFGMGKSSKRGGKGFPAIAMTQHGANKFCHWLSAKTGHFYRLPTEAEWEYACRAGTTTAYSYGDDLGALTDYGWFFDNSNDKYQEVGKKKPNPWGLYDMHGNVTEWVLDQYSAEFYKTLEAAGIATDPWNKATKPYPHSVRGGSWDDDPAALRSAARHASGRHWKMTDPQLPKGKWYLTDAKIIGFRLVRPLAVPSAEELQKYWISGVEKE